MTTGPQTRTRRLRVDAAAQTALDGIIAALHAERTACGRSHDAVAAAAGAQFRGRAIPDWEKRRSIPKLQYLVLWSDALHYRLAIVGPDGQERCGPVRQRPGEGWPVFECRRLASPMQERRRNAGWSRDELGQRVGVSACSVLRWEMATAPPRPIALIVWARTFGYDLALRKKPARPPRGQRAATAPTTYNQGEQRNE